MEKYFELEDQLKALRLHEVDVEKPLEAIKAIINGLEVPTTANN